MAEGRPRASRAESWAVVVGLLTILATVGMWYVDRTVPATPSAPAGVAGPTTPPSAASPTASTAGPRGPGTTAAPGVGPATTSPGSPEPTRQFSGRLERVEPYTAVDLDLDGRPDLDWNGAFLTILRERAGAFLPPGADLADCPNALARAPMYANTFGPQDLGPGVRRLCLYTYADGTTLVDLIATLGNFNDGVLELSWVGVRT